MRAMSQAVIVEILDMDEATDEIELSEALNEATGNTEGKSIDIKAIRTVFRGTKKAVVAVCFNCSQAVACELKYKEGRLKVGWVRCPVREKM